MRVWRLCRRKWSAQPLDGEGPRRVGGRWGPPGVPMVYCAESISLAALESLVHFDVSEAPEGLVAIEVVVPDDVSVEVVSAADLPRHWREFPPVAGTVRFGELWAKERRSLVLSVPSAVVPRERNFLINPLHEERRRVRCEAPEAFVFDPRLFPQP